MKLFIKARGHKYKRKWKDKNGKWRYEYSKVRVKEKGLRAQNIKIMVEWEKEAEASAEKKKQGRSRKVIVDVQKKEHPKMIVDFDAVTERIEKKDKTPEQKLVMDFNKFFSELHTGFSIVELEVEQWLRKSTTFIEDILSDDNHITFENLTEALKENWKPRELGIMIYLNADLNDIDEVNNAVINMEDLYTEGSGKYNQTFMATWLRRNEKDWSYFTTNEYSGKSDFEEEFGKGVSAGAVLAKAYDDDISLEEAKQVIMAQYADRLDIGAFYTPENLKSYLNDAEYTEVKDMMTVPFAEITALTASKGINESYKALGETGDFYCVKPRSGEHIDARKNIKTGTFAVREAGAYIIDKALGFDMVPPTILRQDKDLGLSSMQLWKEEGDIGTVVDYHASINETDKFKASIFDFIAFNTDRHAGNFIVNSFGDITLIDNGLCMPYTDDDKYNYRSVLHESLVKDLVGGGSFVSNYPALQIPDTIMTHLDSVNIPELGDTLLKLGIDEEAVEHMLERFDWVVQNKILPSSNDLDEQTWSNR